MNTIPQTLFPLLTLALLTVSCISTVHVNVEPRDAMISIYGDTPEPADEAKPFTRPFFLKRKVEITKPGYAKHTVEVTSDTAEEVDVILDRIVTFSSIPESAHVTDSQGQVIGDTPCLALVPYNHTPVTYRISKDGFVPYTTTISPQDDDTNVYQELYSDCHGRFIYSINYTPSGFPYPQKSMVEIRNLTAEHTDQAQRILTLPTTLYPENMTVIHDSNTLLLTVITPADAASTNWYTSKLMSYDCTSGALTNLTDGTYFEHHGVKRGKTLFFLSRKTGRTDLWQSDTLPVTDDCQLHTTNRFVKSALDITADGKKILLTATHPNENQRPKLSILDMTLPGKHVWKVLTDGANAAWSPNGTEIAFQSGTPARLFRIHANGSHQSPINHLPGKHQDKEPTWSPDGTKIAFASNRGNENPQNFDIWLLDLKTNAAAKIASSPAIDDKPVFSHDGNTLFFRSNRNASWGIWKVSATAKIANTPTTVQDNGAKGESTQTDGDSAQTPVVVEQ